MVTFSYLIESSGIVEGEIGDLSKNMAKDFRREGSEKEWVVLGIGGDPGLIGGELL